MTETALSCLVTTQRPIEVLVIRWPRCFEVVYICCYLFSVLYKCQMMISTIRRRKKDQSSWSSCVVSVWVKFTCEEIIDTKKPFTLLREITRDLLRSLSLPKPLKPRTPSVFFRHCGQGHPGSNWEQFLPVLLVDCVFTDSRFSCCFSRRGNSVNWSLLCLSLPDHLVSEFRLYSPKALSQVYQTLFSIVYQHQWILDYFYPSYSWFLSWFHHKIHLNLCRSSVSCLLFSHVLGIFFEDKIVKYVTLPYSSLSLIFNFSFLSSWHWLNNAIQSLHFIASHICWPFFHSLSCYSCSKFLIYCDGFFHIIQSCSGMSH